MLNLLILIILVPIFVLAHELAHAQAAKFFGEKDIEIHLGSGKKIFEYKSLHIHLNIFGRLLYLYE